MIKQSNELVALEWLIDPLNQEFWALHAHITPSPSELLAHFARQYDIIGNVLVMANLPDFTKMPKPSPKLLIILQKWATLRY